jgi:adenylate kinase
MRFKAVLLFGAPGSGKGTQGKILGSLPEFHHFACGDVFRSLDPTSRLGRLFAQYSQGGGLVPDEFTIELWSEAIQGRIDAGRFNPQTDILLLDGIPRTLAQAQLLDCRIEVLAIIYLVCNNVEEIVSRLRRRAAVDGRKDDTDEEVIRYRLDVYEEVTRPLLEFYPRNKIIRVNAVRPPEEVSADLRRALGALKR